MWNSGFGQNNCCCNQRPQCCCNQRPQCCCGKCCKKEEKKEFVCHCEEKKDDCNKNFGCSHNQCGFGMNNY